VAASVFEELAARGGLNVALGGRDAESLTPLLRHVAKYVGEPRHTRLLVGVAHRLLDAYGEVAGLSPDVDLSLAQLRESVSRELALQEALMEVQGMLEPILAAAVGGLSLG